MANEKDPARAQTAENVREMILWVSRPGRCTPGLPLTYHPVADMA